MLNLNITRVLVVVGALACLASPAAAQCPPATPGSMAASNGTQCNGVLVDWNAVSGATFYEVWRSTSSGSLGGHLVDVPVPATQYTDLTALPGTHYWYRVRAVRALCPLGTGTGPFAGPNEGWRGDTPGTPSNVEASDGSACAFVEVTWDAVPGLPNYQVFRSTTNNSGSSNLVGTAPAPGFQDQTALPGVEYHYWVRANTLCGTSGFSSGDSGFKGIPTPSNLEALPDCGGVDLFWNVLGTPLIQIYRGDSDQLSSATLVGTTVALFWIDVTAEPWTTYYYWIRSQSPCGTSEYIGPVSAEAYAIPEEPENVAASVGTACGTIDVSWDAVTGAQSYLVLHSVSSNFLSAILLAEVEGPAYTHTGPAQSVPNFYWVRAKNWCGPGLPNDPPASATLPLPLQFNAHPVNQAVFAGQSAFFAVNAIGWGQVTYQWQRNGVQVQNGGPISGANTLQLTINPVSPAHAGEYKAVVVDNCGQIESDPATLTVLCYADCNGVGGLTIADFGCFQTKFVAGDPYADCNGVGGLTIADFGCFQTQFVGGCP